MSSERLWTLAAVAAPAVVLGVLAISGGLSAGSSGHGWRLTSEDAVSFDPGYFCSAGPGGRRVRLVLAQRELIALDEGSTRVVGPFSSMARARVAC